MTIMFSKTITIQSDPTFKFTKGFRYIKLYLREHLFMIAWITTNLLIFGYSYLRFRFNPAYHYTHQTIGHGLFISRGTASVLNFSSFIIFIPMCRTLLTSLRSLTTPSIVTINQQQYSSPSKSSSSSTTIFSTISNPMSKFGTIGLSVIQRLTINPVNRLLVSLIDKSQRIHIAAAYTICLSGLIHSIAHIINSAMASVNYNHQYPTINLASFPGQHPLSIISGSVAGVTGIAMNLILLIVFITSTITFRRDNYNLFKYTHFLTIIFVILILCHPLGGLLKEQTNLDQHTIGCDQIIKSNVTINLLLNKLVDYNSTTTTINGSSVDYNSLQLNQSSSSTQSIIPCDEPIFKPLASCTWIWLSISLTIYLIDLILRLWRRRSSITVINSSLTDDHINLELSQIKGSKSIIKQSLPGQYIYLNCPKIPVIGTNETFNLNIKLNGDWTNKLGNLINQIDGENDHIKMTNTNGKDKQTDQLKFYIDGPFSSPLQDLLKHRLCVCIAGGIGVTPFISFLSLLRSNPTILTSKSVKIEKLYFIWICRNVSNLSGFVETLAQTINFNHRNQRGPLRLTIYLTQETQETMLVNVNRLGARDEMLINNLLRNSIFLGKPKLKTIFQQLQRNYHNQKVSVFCSGSSGLRKEIKKTCRTINLNGSRFVFKHEDFGF
ncbi:NADPH oxidase 4-like isoform X2 [Panonychus citri]|uniref:NADPH oxidase 4-like isoform X2 n=1 Tax=Panonychus citri TaxID=50023 RepID=UPI0023073216|nr:NADPH oxidase 4-like isoform X2 [Panonychus citri]